MSMTGLCQEFGFKPPEPKKRKKEAAAADTTADEKSSNAGNADGSGDKGKGSKGNIRGNIPAYPSAAKVDMPALVLKACTAVSDKLTMIKDDAIGLLPQVEAKLVEHEVLPQVDQWPLPAWTSS